MFQLWSDNFKLAGNELSCTTTFEIINKMHLFTTYKGKPKNSECYTVRDG